MSKCHSLFERILHIGLQLLSRRQKKKGKWTRYEISPPLGKNGNNSFAFAFGRLVEDFKLSTIGWGKKKWFDEKHQKKKKKRKEGGGERVLKSRRTKEGITFPLFLFSLFICFAEVLHKGGVWLKLCWGPIDTHETHPSLPLESLMNSSKDINGADRLTNQIKV